MSSVGRGREAGSIAQSARPVEMLEHFPPLTFTHFRKRLVRK